MDKKMSMVMLSFAMLFGNPIGVFGETITATVAPTTVPPVPSAIVTTQSQSQSILPEAYASYSTMMKTVVTDYNAGFGFTLPWRVADGIMIDRDVRSESEHINGYSFHLTSPQVDETYTVSFTKRNNTAPQGVSQKQWNSTWYDIPIKGMTNTEYVDIWRKHSEIGDKNNISGGFFEHKGATSARWSQIVPKDTLGSETTTLFEVEYIMAQDPTHRYNLASTYPTKAQTFIEQGILGTVAPSFHLVNSKEYHPTGDIMVADGISFVKPVGFTRIKENGKIAFEKGPVRLDVESIAVPQRMNISAPTLGVKQRLGDLYVANLVDINHATIEKYESHIINGQVSFFVAGRMMDPRQNNAAEVAFAASIMLGNEGNIGVTRILAPVGTDVTTPVLMTALDGLRISEGLQNNKSTMIL